MKPGISPASQHISSPKPAQYGRCLPGVHQLSTSHFTQHRAEIVFFLTSFCQLRHVCNSLRETVHLHENKSCFICSDGPNSSDSMVSLDITATILSHVSIFILSSCFLCPFAKQHGKGLLH